MLLPGAYLWLEPVLIASIIVFVVALIGNTIAFGSRFVNALVTALIFAAIFGALVYFGYGDIQMRATTTPAANAPAATN